MFWTNIPLIRVHSPTFEQHSPTGIAGESSVKVVNSFLATNQTGRQLWAFLRPLLIVHGESVWRSGSSHSRCCEAINKMLPNRDKVMTILSNKWFRFEIQCVQFYLKRLSRLLATLFDIGGYLFQQRSKETSFNNILQKKFPKNVDPIKSYIQNSGRGWRGQFPWVSHWITWEIMGSFLVCRKSYCGLVRGQRSPMTCQKIVDIRGHILAGK